MTDIAGLINGINQPTQTAGTVEANNFAEGTEFTANVLFDFDETGSLPALAVDLVNLPASAFTHEGSLFGEPLDVEEAYTADTVNVLDMDALI